MLQLVVDNAPKLEAKAVLTVRKENGTDYFLIEVHWSGVKIDRMRSMGWTLPANKTKLAIRLISCINAQAYDAPPVIKTDINGQTYVCDNWGIFGRHMNADLKRKGF